MSADWDLITRSKADENKQDEKVCYSSFRFAESNGLHREIRFTIGNRFNIITDYLQKNLERPVIINLARDMMYGRMQYLLKIVKGYEVSRGNVDIFAAYCFINEFLAGIEVLGEFEYNNFSGNRKWADPQKWVKERGESFHYNFKQKRRGDMLEDIRMPGHDWLFSINKNSCEPMTRNESAHRARMQRIIFGKELVKPETWDYDNWREENRKKMVEKKPIRENTSSTKWLICTFIGRVSNDTYREFRLRYTSDMMDFVVPDIETFLNDVVDMISEQEAVSQYKYMWGTVKTAVSINTAKYIYALFKQGEEAVLRFEDENMNENFSNWAEDKPLSDFFEYFNKTHHYETTIPAPIVERRDPQLVQSEIDFWKNVEAQTQIQSFDDHFKQPEKKFHCRPMTEEELFPVETAAQKIREQQKEAQQADSEGTQEATSVEESWEIIDSPTAESTAVKILTVIDTSVKEGTDETPVDGETDGTPIESHLVIKKDVELEHRELEPKPVLSYAKVVEKKKSVELNTPNSQPSSPEPVLKETAPPPVPKPDDKNHATRKTENGSWQKVGVKSYGNHQSENKKARVEKKNSRDSPTLSKKKTTTVNNLKGVEVPGIKEGIKTKKEQIEKEHEKKVEEKEVLGAIPDAHLIVSIKEKSSEAKKKKEKIIPSEVIKKAEEKELKAMKKNTTSVQQKKESVTSEEDVSMQSQNGDLPEDLPKETKTAKRKAKKAAAKLRLEQLKSESTDVEMVEKLTLTADDNSFLEAEFDIQVKKTKSKNKKKKKKNPNVKTELTTVEAHFTDDLATVYVNNAILAAHDFIKSNTAPIQPPSSNIQYADLVNEPYENHPDEYVPGQTVTHDYRPGVRLGSRNGESSSSQRVAVDPASHGGTSTAPTASINDDTQLVPVNPENEEHEVRMADPTERFVERACDPLLHDMFRQLKFIADHQATSIFRNVDSARRKVINKRIQKFQNVYLFRHRIAKAMLFILDIDVAADYTGMRETNVIRHLLAYIEEPFATTPESHRGSRLDLLTKTITFAGDRESMTISRGLRYIDLRISELDPSEILYDQYSAISDKLCQAMKEQEVVYNIVRNVADFDGYEDYL